MAASLIIVRVIFSRAKEGALPRGISYNFSVAAMRVVGRGQRSPKVAKGRYERRDEIGL